MNQSLEKIIQLDQKFHHAGILGAPALREIVRLCPPGSIQHSMETGAGQSTLLLSQLSDHHTAFALGEEHGDGSVSAAKRSTLLRPGVVSFVTGPSQLTLPVHRFRQPLQLALIDGPHGFPFPMLEYYHIYPHLAPGALLVIDDSQIPSVRMLIEFLDSDHMFERVSLVHSTAFFRRTDAPPVNPLGDDWWLQGYNTRHHPDLRYVRPKTLFGRAYCLAQTVLGKHIGNALLRVSGRLKD